MLLSIFIATKDRREFLPTAIDSVLAQEEGRFELVIFDNGESVADLIPDSPAIRYVHGTATGPADAFQQALDLCRGDVVMPMADDDRLTPDAVTSVLDGIGGSEWGYAQTAYQVEGKTRFLLGEPWSLKRMRQDYYLGGAVFWRKRLTGRLGGFDSAFDGAADYDLYLRFGEHTEPVFIPHVIYLYNDHPGTDSRMRPENQRAKAQKVRERALGPRPKVAAVTPWIAHHELIPMYRQAMERADQIVVIDNGGGPRAEDIGPHASVIRPESPLGFAAANNLGAAAVRSDIDVVLFVNNDVSSFPDWIEAVRADVSDGALYGPSIGRQTIGGVTIPYVEGWCVAATRSTWEEVGEWDAERFPRCYWEDVELSLRAVRAGLDLRRAPWKLRHLGGVSTSTTRGAWDGFEAQRAVLEEMVKEALAA